jgi:hypothetical protein
MIIQTCNMLNDSQKGKKKLKGEKYLAGYGILSLFFFYIYFFKKIILFTE